MEDCTAKYYFVLHLEKWCSSVRSGNEFFIWLGYYMPRAEYSPLCFRLKSKLHLYYFSESWWNRPLVICGIRGSLAAGVCYTPVEIILLSQSYHRIDGDVSTLMFWFQYFHSHQNRTVLGAWKTRVQTAKCHVPVLRYRDGWETRVVTSKCTAWKKESKSKVWRGARRCGLEFTAEKRGQRNIEIVTACQKRHYENVVLIT